MEFHSGRKTGSARRFASILRATICFSLIAVLVVSATMTQAADTWYVGAKWRASDRVSMDKIDHSVWNSLLQKYVDDSGLVDYARWKRSAADMQQLDTYLKQLSRASTKSPASKAGQLAFWINAYNAVTIRGILREYPTTSIRNHTAKLFGYNIWKNLLLVVGDGTYSLETMEHQILRKMGDPRIHFAIVCASISCPKLRNEAYTPSKVNEQLDDNARDFFRNRRNFRYDAQQNRFYLSSILKWFAEDFGGSQAAVLKRIAPYLPQDAAAAARRGNVSVSYLDYNWGINEQRGARNARR